MRTLGLVVLSLVTVTFAVQGADRLSNQQRQLVQTLEENPEWQKYFASPIGSPNQQQDVDVSVTSQRNNNAPPDEDANMDGPGHAWVVAPYLQAVIQSRGGKGSASTSSSGKSSKGKHKSKSKHSAGSEYDDDFFDYMNEAEASDDINGTETESSQHSYKSKSLKKKVSKESGDRESDCQFMNGVYFGKDCEESKYSITDQG